jgi:hypothetical protein
MLWNASAFNGYAIEVSDGQLGTVSDLLFEDVGWAVRWLVVDTGNWLPGRKVILPLTALGQPDQVLRKFPVALTMRQVQESPDIDTNQPVSRQIEAQAYSHYGREPYWRRGSLPTGDATAMPSAGLLSLPELTPLDPIGVDTQPSVGDQHLRGVAAIAMCHINATDGAIGHVVDLLVDDGSWHIRYITVDTLNWWPGETVLISPRSIQEIDWPHRLVQLDVDRQKVRDSPKYDKSITVDGLYDERFLTYYGIKWIAP